MAHMGRRIRLVEKSVLLGPKIYYFGFWNYARDERKPEGQTIAYKRRRVRLVAEFYFIFFPM